MLHNVVNSLLTTSCSLIDALLQPIAKELSGDHVHVEIYLFYLRKCLCFLVTIQFMSVSIGIALNFIATFTQSSSKSK